MMIQAIVDALAVAAVVTVEVAMAVLVVVGTQLVA
jgi:hypothetical protein